MDRGWCDECREVHDLELGPDGSTVECTVCGHAMRGRLHPSPAALAEAERILYCAALRILRERETSKPD
jgi:hypothetical protein